MQEIIFDQIAHTYTESRTGKELASVNHIINEVYGSGVEFVDPKILKAAAKIGTDIHADVHNWWTSDAYYAPEHIETVKLIEYFEMNNVGLEKAESELIVHVPGMFAGTADLFSDHILTDYKTSKNKPTRKMLAHWQKQLSFYFYALKKMGKEPKYMGVLHVTKKGVVPYPMKYLGDKFVEDTYQAFVEGRKLEEPKETSLQTVDKRTIQKLQRTLEKMATMKKEVDAIRERIKEEMEKRAITALQIGKVSVTYVGPGKRKSFDTDRFKAENEDLYEQYTKESEVKSSIRIKIDEKCD